MKKTRKELAPGVSWQPLKAEWVAWWSGKGPVLFFAAKFGGLCLLLYILLAVPSTDRALYFYLEANARISNLILNFLGQNTHVTDVTIRSPAFAIAIRRGCDAIEPAWLLGAAIAVFPGPWRRKLAGILIGIVILQALNLVRIVTLFWIGSRFPSMFAATHLEIWPTAFIVVSIMLFVSWKGWVDEK